MIDVSVIILSWERPALLRECIARLRKWFLQDMEWELIIADDGSESKEVQAILAENDEACVIRNPDRGKYHPGYVLNSAYAACNTDYVLYLEDDQFLRYEFTDEYMSVIFQLFSDHPDIRLVKLAKSWHGDMKPEPVMAYGDYVFQYGWKTEYSYSFQAHITSGKLFDSLGPMRVDKNMDSLEWERSALFNRKKHRWARVSKLKDVEDTTGPFEHWQMQKFATSRIKGHHCR